MSAQGFTFGIELEYIVPFIYTGDPDPQPTERRAIDRTDPQTNDFRDQNGVLIDNIVYDRVRRTLQFAGLPAAKMPEMSDGGPPSLPTQWDAVVDESLMENDEFAELYGNRYIPLEMRSPVLSADRPGFRTIRLAVDALVSKHRLFITETCGYHVHVGRGTAGFSLPALKNIAAFLWVFEPQIATLHPKERQNYGYASPMRKKANIARFAPDLTRGIREIYAASSKRKLVYLIHWTDEFENDESDEVFIRNMAYNFINIVLVDGKKTVEFRQAASTTDGFDVKMWAEVCVGIVMACAEKGEAEWSAFLYDAAAKEQNRSSEVLKIAGLLRKIGLSDQATWAQERSQRLGTDSCLIQ
ncbi:hypothetical protein V493_00441 [Pseudogymnoascus sp. VKM F-4281 (FW-2241)]|nr:hypothetical protein V493_00441 [Pseudogymnoascus sp. VKM F-4281 (FW-2241)]